MIFDRKFFALALGCTFFLHAFPHGNGTIRQYDKKTDEKFVTQYCDPAGKDVLVYDTPKCGPVGFIAARNSNIEDFATDKNHRGEGIAQKLIGAMVQKLKTSGYRTITLTPKTPSDAVKNLCEKTGFTPKNGSQTVFVYSKSR